MSDYECEHCGLNEEFLPPHIHPEECFDYAPNGGMYCYSCLDEYIDYLMETDPPVEDDGEGFPTVEDFEWMIVNNCDWEGKPLD